MLKDAAAKEALMVPQGRGRGPFLQLLLEAKSSAQAPLASLTPASQSRMLGSLAEGEQVSSCHPHWLCTRDFLVSASSSWGCIRVQGQSCRQDAGQFLQDMTWPL